MMKLYNSLTRKVEELHPIRQDKIGMYTCGPTVYSYMTVGNWRTYVLSDVLLRVLKYLGNEVDFIMNITDVGHLTGDNLGDADTGEDRMEKAAKREGKTAWDVAEFYANDFLAGFKELNLTAPRKFAKATEHIDEQIEMVKQIEKKGFAYETSDGIYFDTGAYEKAGNIYGELSTLDEIEEGARVKKNPEKKNPRDFALWKFSPEGSTRQMEWDSPWMPDSRKGFPGWHIECSAMSAKYLGEQFDIHVGGEDLRSTHHPNEIAQAEVASGKKPFVKYWVHGAFLQIDGGRMGKSLGNAYTLDDIKKRGLEPLALRYFYLTGHYRKPLNFTWKAIEGAQIAYRRLMEMVSEFRNEEKRNSLSEEKLGKIDEYRKKFQDAIENDLGMPEALAVVWEVAKSNIPAGDKYELLVDFDMVLGLGLSESKTESGQIEIPEDVQRLVDDRQNLREEKKFETADKIRREIEEKGFVVKDIDQGVVVKKR